MKKEDLPAEEILRKEDLKVLKIISYDNIVEFVFENISYKRPPIFFYFMFNLITLIILVIFSIYFFNYDLLGTGIFIKSIIAGILAGSIIVIPFHEIFHAVAYRLTGARNIKFGMDLKQMIFYVAADRFLTNRKSLNLVALAPFVMINLAAVTIFYLYPIPTLITGGLCFLLFHNIMCIGDFAMMAYFHMNREKELVTFDIVEDRISYICERIK